MCCLHSAADATGSRENSRDTRGQRFESEAGAVSRGEIRSSDFVNAEIPLVELPKMFEHMKHRNGEMKVAVIP